MKILLIGSAGYCGSYLYKHLNLMGYEVIGIDQFQRYITTDICCDYRSIEAYSSILPTIDTVLFFAGLSSVQKAEKDAIDTLSANVTGLMRLREHMRENAYLLYASSASVYSGEGWKFAKEEDSICPNLNLYDQSKFAFDYIQQAFYKNCLGLRMGTICGMGESPTFIRPELVFNAMNISAINDKKVKVSNLDSLRSILFLDDLFHIVTLCLQKKPTGILNAYSLNVSIGYLAKTIAQYYLCPIERLQDSKTYSFRMDNSRLLGLGHNPTQVSLGDRCHIFEEEYLLRWKD